MIPELEIELRCPGCGSTKVVGKAGHQLTSWTFLDGDRKRLHIRCDCNHRFSEEITGDIPFVRDEEESNRDEQAPS